jgi:hypothetical protein
VKIKKCHGKTTGYLPAVTCSQLLHATGTLEAGRVCSGLDQSPGSLLPTTSYPRLRFVGAIPSTSWESETVTKWNSLITFQGCDSDEHDNTTDNIALSPFFHDLSFSELRNTFQNNDSESEHLSISESGRLSPIFSVQAKHGKSDTMHHHNTSTDSEQCKKDGNRQIVARILRITSFVNTCKAFGRLLMEKPSIILWIQKYCRFCGQRNFQIYQ